jgi:hypothetical protein
MVKMTEKIKRVLCGYHLGTKDIVFPTVAGLPQRLQRPSNMPALLDSFKSVSAACPGTNGLDGTNWMGIWKSPLQGLYDMCTAADGAPFSPLITIKEGAP